jgi:hypothetical protein
LRNEALISILKKIEQDYPIKYLKTNTGHSVNNMWFSAMRFAEGRSNTSSFDLAAIMIWVKETYPEKFPDLFRQIFDAFSDPENPTPLLELQDNLYKLYLRTFNMAELTPDILTAFKDEHNVGCGDVIIDVVMANLWKPSETTLDPVVTKSIVDVLPSILELNGKFEKLPDYHFSLWSDPLHPKLSFSEWYLEERKNRIDNTISSLLKNKQIAVEIFMRAIANEDAKPNIWEAIANRYPDKEQSEYTHIATTILNAEHLFMSRYTNTTPKDNEFDREKNLRENLFLARTIYLDNFNFDNRFEFMIKALLSTMTGDYTYLYNNQPIAENLDSRTIRDKLILPRTKEGDAEFERFIAAINVVKVERKKYNTLKN